MTIDTRKPDGNVFFIVTRFREWAVLHDCIALYFKLVDEMNRMSYPEICRYIEKTTLGEICFVGLRKEN